MHRPAVYNLKGLSGKITEYYLTDTGLAWLFKYFKSHSYPYCRSKYSNFFIHMTEEEFEHLEDLSLFDNFRGIKGQKTIRGTKQPALIIRKVRRCERKYYFNSIREARAQLKIWLTAYPIEEFTIYRIRTQKGVTFKEKIPLIIEAPHAIKNNHRWR